MKFTAISPSFFAKQLSATVLMLVLLFTACSKETAQEQPRSGVMQIIEYKSGDDITKFEYNADSTVHTINHKEDPLTGDSNVTYTVKYLSNKKIDELVGSNGVTVKFSYTNNILSKTEHIVAGTQLVESSFVYSGNVLQSIVLSLGTTIPNQMAILFKSEFEYNAAGNANKTSLSGMGLLTPQFLPMGYISTLYDSKTSPFAKMPEITFLFWQFASKNNFTKQEYFSNSILEAIVEFSYTYNMQGYPINGTAKVTETGQPATVSNLSYTYR